MKVKFGFLLLILLYISSNTIAQTTPTIQGNAVVDFPNENEQETLTWLVIDDNPIEYGIIMIEDSSSSQETNLTSGEWSEELFNGSQLEFEISVNIILEVGIYSFIVRVLDLDNNAAQFVTEVHVGNVEDIEFLPGPGLPISTSSVLLGIMIILFVRLKTRR